MVKKPPCNAGDLGLIPGWEDPLEEGRATHSSIQFFFFFFSIVFIYLF